MEVFLARMVMPRSRSRSLLSMTRSCTRSLARKVPVCCRRRSTRVVFPWSTWAMMAILRMSLRRTPAVMARDSLRAEAGAGSGDGRARRRGGSRGPLLHEHLAHAVLEEVHLDDPL